MNEMKDRLARAMWQFMSDLWAKQGMPLCAFDDPDAEWRGKQNCLDSVDFIFSTIRDPTDAMITAAEQSFASAGRDEIGDAWRAMTDEAKSSA
jgi:hypothetical protein